MTRRVVVTGVGLITPIGNSVEETWAGLMSGCSGADAIKKFDTEKFSVKFACEIKDFDPLKFIPKKEARKMGAFIHYAIAASIEAVADSRLELNGAGKLPEIGEGLGRGISNFRKSIHAPDEIDVTPPEKKEGQRDREGAPPKQP